MESQKFAICTLITSDAYLPGAIALVAALRDVHPHPASAPEVDFDTVCIVTPETLDIATIKLLRRTFDVVVGVEVIDQTDSKNLDLLGRPDLNHVLTKLHVFRLEQYSKILFLDADVLPIRPLSHLLTLPHNFAAVPDVGWPDIFNSGVFVCSPSEAAFNELMELNKTKGSWDGGDQGLLNEWRGKDWHRLSFIYNTTPTASYTYAPAYERFGKDIAAIHFIGPDKPWKQIPYRAPGSEAFRAQVESGTTQAYNHGSLVDRWFAVYDRHYRAVQSPSGETQNGGIDGLDYQVRRYQAAWDDGSSHIGAEVVPNSSTPAMLSVYPSSHPPAVSGGNTWPTSGTRITRGAPPPPGGLPSSWNKHAPGVTPGQTAFVNPSQSYAFGPRATFLAPPGSGIASDSDAYSDGGELSAPWSSMNPSHMSAHVGGGLGLDELRRVALEGFDGAYLSSMHWSGMSSGGEGIYIRMPLDGRIDLMRPRPQFGEKDEQYGRPRESGPASLGAHHRSLSSSSPQPGHSQHAHAYPHHRREHQQYTHSVPLYLPPGVELESSDDGNRQSKIETRPHHHHEHPAYLHHRRHSDDFRKGSQSQHRQSARLGRTSSKPSSRPSSPPKVPWDPAKEPPPNEPPPPMNLPSGTYFPNAWDVPSTYGDAWNQQPSSLRDLPDAEPFFRPPPPAAIPETLLRQGYYQNVLGPVSDLAEDENPEGENEKHVPPPRPDASKVKNIFPWEEGPRHLPSRIFPRTESPIPPGVSQFVEEQRRLAEATLQSKDTHTPTQEDPYSYAPTNGSEMRAVPPPTRRFDSWQSSSGARSPPASYPGNLAYSNVWDGVPSIQKYASKLVRPVDNSRALEMMKFNDSEYLKERDWEEKIEAGSRDADDEDDGDEDEDEDSHERVNRPRGYSNPDEFNSRAQQSRVAPRTDRRSSFTGRLSTGRARSGTGSKSPQHPFAPSRVGKETREKEDQQAGGVQTNNYTPSSNGVRRSSGNMEPFAAPQRPSPMTSRRNSLRAPLATAVQDDAFSRQVEGLPHQSDHPPFQLQHPGGLASSQATRPNTEVRRQYGAVPSPRVASPARPPNPSISSVGSMTSASTEVSGSLPSPALSARRVPSGRISLDTAAAGGPPHKALRTWDPSTGVDVFKRGNEEVLARFLRMSSWEEPEATASSPTAAR